MLWMFNLQSSYQPAGDQPKAIKQIADSFSEGKNKITLLWATGTGKTFTIANIIKEVQKPTLVISHNKTLAAQLATEFKAFFPENAVHYFMGLVSHLTNNGYSINHYLRNEQNKPLRGTIRVEVDGFYYYIELLPQ